MNSVKRLVLGLVLLALPLRAEATTYYMSTSGSDSNSCATATSTTPASEKLTIASAAPCLAAGDTLLIRAGTYANSVLDTSTLTLASGTMGSPITVSAYPGGLAASTTPGVRAGADSVTLTPPNAVNLINFVTQTSSGNPGPSWWIFEDVTLDGTAQTSDPPDGLVYQSGSSSNVTFLHMEVKNSRIDCFTTSPNNGEAQNNSFLYNSIHDCGTDAVINIGYPIYLNTAGNTVTGNDLYNGNGYGLQINNTPGSSASNNTISFNKMHNNVPHGTGGVGGMTGGGMNVGCSDVGAGHCDNTQIFNNLVYNNGVGGGTGFTSYGLFIQTNASNTKIYFNTIYGNTAQGIEMVNYDGTNPPVVKNNIVYNNLAGNQINDDDSAVNGTGAPTLSNNVTTNPSFKNVSLNDFHLTAASTIAIGKGVTITGITTDFDGVSRPNPPAIGAYEFVNTNSVTLDSTELSDCSFSSVVGTTGITCTDITVGSNSNRALVCHVALSLQTASSQVLTWDFGGTAQTMTSIVQANSGGATGRAELWGLVAPTVGNKTLKVTWVGTSDISVFCDSWYNVNQAGGATSFPHSGSATGTGTTASVTITSAANNATMDTSANPSPFNGTYSSPSQTLDYFAGGLSALDSAGSHAPGAATVAHSWSISNSQQWVSVGTDIQVFGGATGTGEGQMLLGMR